MAAIDPRSYPIRTLFAAYHDWPAYGAKADSLAHIAAERDSSWWSYTPFRAVWEYRRGRQAEGDRVIEAFLALDNDLRLCGRGGCNH